MISDEDLKKLEHFWQSGDYALIEVLPDRYIIINKAKNLEVIIETDESAKIIIEKMLEMGCEILPMSYTGNEP